MAKEIVDVMVEGGKATAAPPLGPALGPMGVNIGQVVGSINDKTKVFAGMKVPVKVKIDKETKEFTIEIGTPPASQLLKKEAGITKGSGNPLKNKIGKLTKAQLRQIAEAKLQDLNANDIESAEKIVAGTARSMGVDVEK